MIEKIKHRFGIKKEKNLNEETEHVTKLMYF